MFKRYLLIAGAVLCALGHAATTLKPITLHSGSGTGSVLSSHTTVDGCVTAAEVRKLATFVCKQAGTWKADPAILWTKCADEDGVCSFAGRHRVRYGANGVYAIVTGENAVTCTNATFGDPVPGVRKSCEVETAIAPPPVVLPPAPPASGPVSGVQPLAWTDSRVRYWIRADKTNSEIGARFRAAGQQYSWVGIQGCASSPQYETIERCAEPNTSNGRVILARSGGYFQHRIWTGMPLWTDATGGRMRSAIHTSDSPAHGTPAVVGHSYWYAFGAKFYPDMFSQANPGEELHSVQILDFHHSGGTALSSATPWAMHVDGNGYWMRILWNKNDSGISSPTGETQLDGGAQRITMIRDTSKDTTNPHFFAWRFKLGPDASAYTEMWRQIGVDGPITKIGSWNTPNSYANDPKNSVFPKHGIHRWFPNLNGQGQPTRSIDMPGAILVEDVSLPVEVIFKSLTVAIPR